MTTTHRSTTGGWISAASSARETEAITRALQISISGGGGGDGSSLASSSSLSTTATPTSSDAAATVSSFLIFDPTTARNGARTVQEKKISKKKRKSRSKQVDQTTYITTDPANFRQMVQQITGIQLGSPAAVLKPEPQRAAAGAVLPTLDTSSAFVMERAGAVCGAFEPDSGEGGTGFGWEAPQSQMMPGCYYPTLESWTVM